MYRASDVLKRVRKKYLLAGQLNLLLVAGNFGKICSACGRHEIQYTEQKLDK
jgi:hypothetical protein